MPRGSRDAPQSRRPWPPRLSGAHRIRVRQLRTRYGHCADGLDHGPTYLSCSGDPQHRVAPGMPKRSRRTTMATERSTSSGLAVTHAAPAGASATANVVTPFEAIGREDTPTVGGKGANLGEMLHAGLPVPPGFVITIEAYHRFYEHGELGAEIAARLALVDVDDPDSLQQASRALRDLVLGTGIPDDLRAELIDAYRTLSNDHDDGAPLVAVRSSATAEDTVQFSFAGMFESFLNVRGEAALLRRVKECWASTFGARVLFYRLKQGMPAEMPVAVIVQRMIDSEKSGVMFTVDQIGRAHV